VGVIAYDRLATWQMRVENMLEFISSRRNLHFALVFNIKLIAKVKWQPEI
jgi:hypothetical protein